MVWRSPLTRGVAHRSIRQISPFSFASNETTDTKFVSVVSQNDISDRIRKTVFGSKNKTAKLCMIPDCIRNSRDPKIGLRTNVVLFFITPGKYFASIHYCQLIDGSGPILTIFLCLAALIPAEGFYSSSPTIPNGCDHANASSLHSSTS